MTTVVYTGTREPSPVDGHEIVHLPMLERMEVPLPDGLADEVAASTHVVFYSQNSAEIIVDALGPEPFGRVSVWAVGEHTATYLKERLGVEVQSPPRENFLGLLDAMRASVGPHDRIISFELADTQRCLADQAFEAYVRSIPTYATVRTSWDDLDSLLRRIAPRWVVFASPRAFETFRENLHHRRVGDSYRVAAIGPTTAKSIEAAGDRVDHVAGAPDLDALIAELLES